MTSKRWMVLLLSTLFYNGLLLSQRTYLLRDSTETPMVELGEVAVNASRTNQSLREMSASVSAFGSALLRKNEVKTLSDLSAMAPGFFMPEYGSKLTAPVYIRGIGSRINSPSVGLYVDQVPYFEKASFAFDFFDIERVEILRGPQGTLYGRNTMGGIINIVTRSPFDHQGSTVAVSAGNYGSWSVSAGHYGKPGEKFAWSLSGSYNHNDGFYTNHFNNSKVDEQNSIGFRNRLIYKISDRLTLENIAGYENSNQGGYPYSIYIDSIGKTKEINYNQYSSYKRALFSDALRLKYRNESIEIQSVTSYQLLDDLQAIDQDFTPDSLYFVVQDQYQNMLSQELTIRSKGNDRYNWLLGGFTFIQDFDNSVDVSNYRVKSVSYKSYDHRIMGLALFHQSEWNDFLFKNLGISAGIRLDAEKDLLWYHYDLERLNVKNNLADTTYPALSSLELLPRLSLNYKAGNNQIYALAARGYKTGGFNSTFENPGDLTFMPEYSWNYEAGIKSTLPGSFMYADLSLFYIDWRDQQIYQPVINNDGVRIGSMLKNAGHTFSRGVETSFKIVPVNNLSIMLSYGFTDARFISHVVDSSLNYNGNFIPYIPRHTLAYQLTKSIETKNLKWLDEIMLNLLYRAAGPVYWNERNDYSQNFYGTLDMKISFSKGSATLELWSRNLMNQDYHSYFFEAFSNRYAQSGKPQRFGMNLQVNF